MLVATGIGPPVPTSSPWVATTESEGSDLAEGALGTIDPAFRATRRTGVRPHYVTRFGAREPGA
jgi:hypothetical protein